MLDRDVYILEDENNPNSSPADTVWPATTLDQVFDQKTVTKKSLRTILEELHFEIISGGIGNITFPVTSVNGMTGDVEITREHLDLDQVDNTADIDKPLSNPQRAALMEILDNYNYPIDLSDLYDHIRNSNNPHHVTLEQINSDGSVRDYVVQLIGMHNAGTADSHLDIRNALAALTDIINNQHISFENDLSVLADNLSELSGRVTTGLAAKEDKANKTSNFNDINNLKYPTTKAVKDYLTTQLDEFYQTITEEQISFIDVKVVDSRSDLPTAGLDAYRKIYFVRKGPDGNDEIAVCRLSNGRYSWDIKTFDLLGKLNPDHFESRPEGVSINTTNLANILMSESSMVDLLRRALQDYIPELFNEYYTKDEIDAMHLINEIRILPGTQDGSIRFYINGDQTTMSNDIFVAGLKNLAFQDILTSDINGEGVIEGHHIHTETITDENLADMAVTPRAMTTPHNTILGNVDSVEGRVEPIPIERFAEIMFPWFQTMIDEGVIPAIPDERILELLDNAWASVN